MTPYIIRSAGNSSTICARLSAPRSTKEKTYAARPTLNVLAAGNDSDPLTKTRVPDFVLMTAIPNRPPAVVDNRASSRATPAVELALALSVGVGTRGTPDSL